jgi:hypothetical protein
MLYAICDGDTNNMPPKRRTSLSPLRRTNTIAAAPAKTQVGEELAAPHKPVAEFIYRREYTDMGNRARAAYFLVPFTTMFVMALVPFIVWGDLTRAIVWIASRGFTSLNALIEQSSGVRVERHKIADATTAARISFVLCGLSGLLVISFLMAEWARDEKLLKIGRTLDVPLFWILAGWFSAPLIVSPVATFFICKAWAAVTDV